MHFGIPAAALTLSVHPLSEYSHILYSIFPDAAYDLSTPHSAEVVCAIDRLRFYQNLLTLS